jgi:uncharacterized protein involved in exopolysaccharide biosynthesis
MTENKDQYNFNSLGLLQYAWDKRKSLIIISLIAFIVSIIVSFLITPKYKSTVILFPTAQTSVSKTLLSSTPGGDEGVLTIGEEENAEHLLQVLQSDHIRSRIINKYNLFEHYDIDTASKYPMTQLLNEYKDNISFKRTEYMSIEIEVLDTDPQIAADIANDIASLLDSTMNDMMRDRAMTAFKVVENEYRSLERQIYELEDSLNVLRDLGIYDYESQAEVISDAYAKAIAENNQRGAKQLEEKLKVLAKFGGAYVSIRDFLEHEKKQLSEIKEKYVEAKVEAEQNLPHKFVVDRAYKAEKKSYPKKSIIVILSTISAFILAFITMLTIDNISLQPKKQ